MNRIVRRKREMGERVSQFSHANPSEDASYAAVVGRLDERLAVLASLAQQQQAGFMERRASAARRREIRREVSGALRHLVTVASAASAEEPALLRKYRLPKANATHEVLRTLGRTMLEQGRTDQALLGKHGLADRLLDDLAGALDRYEASVVESNEGRRTHVGASAELAVVAAEVMSLVDMLDGLNRYRFGKDTEKRAAWESARRLVSGPQPADGTPVAPGGEVKPAA
jgi:hypothetical protein